MTFDTGSVHSWRYVPLYARLASTLLMRKPLIDVNSVDCVPLKFIVWHAMHGFNAKEV